MAKKQRSVWLVGGLTAFVLSGGLLGLYARPVSAYTVTGCKWANQNGRQTVKTNYLYSSASPYFAPANDAIGAWNASQGSITFSPVSSGPNVQIYETSLGATGQAGLTSWGCSGGIFSGVVTSRWNQFYTDPYVAAHKKAVMVHELGHALGLDHAGVPCTTAAIMYTNTGYVACGWSTPKSDDTTGITNLYYP